MNARQTTTASVMCTLCEEAGTIETDMDRPEGVASAAIWAVHFTVKHPDIENGLSRYLVVAGGPA